MFFFSKEDENIKFTHSSLEHAYLAILKDDLSSAKAIFEKTDSPRANWGITFVEILKGYLKRYPTYFEIRNFLEIDLDFLIKNEKLDYVEQVLGASDILINTNQETYKYIARVMFENKLYKVAMEYLEKSKRQFYNDPELHFIISKFFLKHNNFAQALKYIEECLKILPDYYPAILLKNEILKNLDS
ncbi:hypothetical protein IJD34_06795 [bacterium]|nr:hypothetical protein [bacterium]